MRYIALDSFLGYLELILVSQAVIRLSKKYLPGMSIGFQHPNVKTHVGDGFEFLKNHKNEFDVIITDSSDPEGPAESLFQKPYFQLLNDALREGGVITTQGCSSPFLPPVFFLWLPGISLFLSFSPRLSLLSVLHLFFCTIPSPQLLPAPPIRPSPFPC